MRLENIPPSTKNRLVSPSFASPAYGEVQPRESLPPVADRRRYPRFKVGDELLCVSDYCAGQILDISPTGMAFQLVNFSLKSAKDAAISSPLQCEQLSILHTGPLSFFIMKNLQVKESHDRTTGLLYPGNPQIKTYRRGVGFAVPLAAKEFDALQPYLSEGGAEWQL